MVKEKIITTISMYHSHGTRTVKTRDKETVKPIKMLDYNQCMGGVGFKDQLLHPWLREKQ
jgi:hypothetical protein